jgi:hypothetical protein
MARDLVQAGQVPDRRRRRLAWVGVFLGFFLLCAAWALSTPYDGTPDEVEHTIRAAGVVNGQVAPDPVAARRGQGAYQTIPASLDRLIEAECFHNKPGTTANCELAPGGDRHLKTVGTVVGRYNPAYYIVVGLPLRFWPDWTGIMLSRLISAGIVAGMLTATMYAAVRWSRRKMVLAGMLVAETPMLFHMAGAINPSPVEIASGLLLFAALIPLLDPGWKVRPAAIRMAGVAAITLATLRGLGPLWLATIVFVVAVPSSRARLGELLRNWTMRRWLIGGFVAGLAGLAWTFIQRANEQALIPTALTGKQSIKLVLYYAWGVLPQEMVGVLGWRDTYLPGLFYLAWYCSFGLLVIGAFAFGRWSDRWRLAAITVAMLGVTTITTALTVQKYGVSWQGRYLLPIAVGLPMLGGQILARRGVVDATRAKQLIRTLVVLLIPAQFGALWITMIRWQRGLANPSFMHFNPLKGAWHPPLGSALPFLCGLVGTALLAAACWWPRLLTRPDAGDEPPSDGEPRHADEPQPGDEPQSIDGSPLPATLATGSPTHAGSGVGQPTAALTVPASLSVH